MCEGKIKKKSNDQNKKNVEQIHGSNQLKKRGKCHGIGKVRINI